MSQKIGNGELHRRAVLIGAAAGLSLVVPRGLAFASDAVGLVKDVRGSALVKRGEKEIPAAAGADILGKDVASTGDRPSRLELQFNPGTLIRLGSNTIFEVDRFVENLTRTMQLDQGAVLVEHDPHAKPDVTLRTPYGLLAARGTTFFAGPSNDVFGIFVESGLVEVQTPNGSVTLWPGEGTNIAKPGAAPTQPVRWRRARIRTALAHEKIKKSASLFHREQPIPSSLCNLLCVGRRRPHNVKEISSCAALSFLPSSSRSLPRLRPKLRRSKRELPLNR